MKATGVARRIDDMGRVVIPKEVRKLFSLKEGTALEIFVDKDAIILQRYYPLCTFCNDAEGTVPLVNLRGEEIPYCEKCYDKLIAHGLIEKEG